MPWILEILHSLLAQHFLLKDAASHHLDPISIPGRPVARPHFHGLVDEVGFAASNAQEQEKTKKGSCFHCASFGMTILSVCLVNAPDSTRFIELTTFFMQTQTTFSISAAALPLSHSHEKKEKVHFSHNSSLFFLTFLCSEMTNLRNLNCVTQFHEFTE